MKAYSIEFFDAQTFELIYYTNLQHVEYNEDYINPTTADLLINLADSNILETGNYIRIVKDEIEYFGIVQEVTSKNNYQTQIKYASFLQKFDQEILFNVDVQGTRTFEEVLAQMIIDIWVNSASFNGSDAVENVRGLSVYTASETRNWGLNLKSDVEGTHFCKISSFMNTFITKAMSKYNISFRVVPDFTAKTIKVYIGKISGGPKTIEADRPNVLSKSVTIAQNYNDVNKLLMYDTSLPNPLTDPIIYYLHQDDTYDRQNRNRIYPIVRRVELITPNDSKTFAEMAKEKADDILGGITRNNYIELEVTADDELVNQRNLEYGQEINIISNGTKYVSVLTGKKIEDTVTLVFGTLRLNLTSRIGAF